MSLYQVLLPQLRAEGHWHADETRWEVFVERDGKAGHRWWLWVFQSRSVVYYLIDPSRSGRVPAAVLSGVDSGVISCHRHGAYRKFSRLHPRIVLSFCRAQQRRDFLSLANDYPSLAQWAMGWVDRIGDLFCLYEQREQASAGSFEYRALQGKLRSRLRTMARERQRALSDPQLPEPASKLMKSMQRHWQGLREFVRHAGIPRDNNAAERALRLAAVGRKNFYGSGAEWSGQLAAQMFSLLMTVKAWADQSAHLAERLPQRLCGRRQSRPGGSEAVSALEHGRGALGPDAPSAGRGRTHPGAFPAGQLVRVYCVRHFSAEDIGVIRQLIEANPTLKRTPLSRRICELFGWRQPNGALKEMSCRVALLRMQADGLIRLPPSQNPKNGRRPPCHSPRPAIRNRQYAARCTSCHP